MVHAYMTAMPFFWFDAVSRAAEIQRLVPSKRLSVDKRHVSPTMAMHPYADMPSIEHQLVFGARVLLLYIPEAWAVFYNFGMQAIQAIYLNTPDGFSPRFFVPLMRRVVCTVFYHIVDSLMNGPRTRVPTCLRDYVRTPDEIRSDVAARTPAAAMDEDQVDMTVLLSDEHVKKMKVYSSP